MSDIPEIKYKPRLSKWLFVQVISFALAGAFFLTLFLGPSWADVPVPHTQHELPKTVVPVERGDNPAAKLLIESSGSHCANCETRIESLEERERQTYWNLLDARSKTLDWWLAFLGVFTAVVGVGGALIPFLMARKDRELMQREHFEIERLLQQTQKEHESVQSMRRQIEEYLQGAKKGMEHIHDYIRTLEAQSGSLHDAKNNKKLSSEVENAAKKVIESGQSDAIAKLRAEALLAGNARDARKASALWKAILAVEKNDKQALYYYSYWITEIARELADKNLPEARRLFAEAREGYQTLSRISASIEDRYLTEHNIGATYSYEGHALAKSNPEQARDFFKRAHQKSKRALEINPDAIESVRNLTSNLLHEVQIIERLKMNSAEASALVEQAKQLLLLHAAKQPGACAYNLACCYAHLNDIGECIKWLNISAQHKYLPSLKHIEEDPDLAKIRATDEFQRWLKTLRSKTGEE